MMYQLSVDLVELWYFDQELKTNGKAGKWVLHPYESMPVGLAYKVMRRGLAHPFAVIRADGVVIAQSVGADVSALKAEAA